MQKRIEIQKSTKTAKKYKKRKKSLEFKCHFGTHKVPKGNKIVQKKYENCKKVPKLKKVQKKSKKRLKHKKSTNSDKKYQKSRKNTKSAK